MQRLKHLRVQSLTDTIDMNTIPFPMRTAQLLATLLFLAPPALAQSRKRSPASAPPPTKPVLVRDAQNSRDWTLHAEVRLHATQIRGVDPKNLPASPKFILKGVEFLYPILDSSAMHEVYPSRMTSEFRIDTVPVDKEPDIIDGYQALSSIGVWKAGEVQSHHLTFIAEIPMTCWETRIDEKGARAIDWPTAPFSKEMALCLDPQLFVECKDATVMDLVKQWAGGDPRTLRPYDLAKRIAEGVLEHMRVTDPPIASQARGVEVGKSSAVLHTGFVVHGAAEVARAKQGSEFDLACLLTAAYRAAGLPARLVIGLDVKRTEERSGTVLRSWSEFFLAREPAPQGPDAQPVITAQDGEWIPVDIFRQWEFSSRAPPQNQRWEYFGHNEEFDFVVPIAYHWLPPERCTNSGPPGIWGWRPTPANPACDAEIKFWAYETPRKGGVDPRPKKK